jgi:hypothetical protein
VTVYAPRAIGVEFVAAFGRTQTLVTLRRAGIPEVRDEEMDHEL